jgi:hypothetical protein
VIFPAGEINGRDPGPLEDVAQFAARAYTQGELTGGFMPRHRVLEVTHLATVLRYAFRWSLALALLGTGLSGCGDGPGEPDVRMQVSIAPAGADTLLVTAQVRNVGNGPAKYLLGTRWCSGTIRFTVKDPGGNRVILENPCVVGPARMPCLSQVKLLDPGENYAEDLQIPGVYWPESSCEPEPLPAGTYTVEVLFYYQAESDPDDIYRSAGESVSFEIVR